jgi:ADP-heptose:LPS heptosyltransferase
VRLKLTFVAALLRLDNILLNSLRALLYRKPGQPGRVLVFRTGSLGDNLCAIPSIIAIRKKYPGAELHILANAGRSSLVTLEKLLSPVYYDQIIDYSGFSKKELFRLLRKKKYDMVVYLPQVDVPMTSLIRDLFFFRFVARSGFGWRRSSIPFFRQTQERHLVFENEITRLRLLLRDNGIQNVETDFGLHTTEADERIVTDAFTRSGLTNRDRNIALVIGAKRPQNRWPIACFKTVAAHFHDRFNIILIGGPEDHALAGPLLGLSRVFDFCGSFTPVQSALALKRCALTLSNDTGPMHLSYAVGTPTIALFSSRDMPGKWFPPASPNNKVFRTKEVACAACFSETCADNICMKAIDPFDVEQVMEEMIKGLNLE